MDFCVICEYIHILKDLIKEDIWFKYYIDKYSKEKLTTTYTYLLYYVCM